jgi:hypothetical protein
MANLKLSEPDVVEKIQAYFKKIRLSGEDFTELFFGKEIMIRPIDTRSDKERLKEILDMARSFGYTHVLHVGDEG